MTDIANATNVSIATVGRVIHNNGYVAEDTRKEIKQLIKTLINKWDNRIAISSMEPGTDISESGYNSYIYVLPLSGGKPRKVTVLSPSFLHGWSPDSRKFAFVSYELK